MTSSYKSGASAMREMAAGLVRGAFDIPDSIPFKMFNVVSRDSLDRVADAIIRLPLPEEGADAREDALYLDDLKQRLNDAFAQRDQALEGLTKLSAAIAARDAEIATLREELLLWHSVFPDIAPESVLPDRSKLEAEIATLRAALTMEQERHSHTRRDLQTAREWMDDVSGQITTLRAALDQKETP